MLCCKGKRKLEKNDQNGIISKAGQRVFINIIYHSDIIDADDDVERHPSQQFLRSHSKLT